MKGNDTSLIHAIRGPITLITVGVLFALNNFTPYRFHQTWPVLLIVFGLLSLVRRSVEPLPPPAPAGYAPPPYNYQPPAPPTASGSYRQSSYPETAPVPAPEKGESGSSSSTQRPGAPGEGGVA
jgi:hypothetical protein